MGRLIVIILAMLSITASAASHWIFITDNNDGDQLYIEKSSIRRDENGIVSLLERWNHIDKSYRLVGVRIDCTKHKWVIDAMVGYNVFGQIEHKFRWDQGPQEWRVAAPNTVSKAEENFVCPQTF